MYDRPEHWRSRVEMERYRFGRGEYRYFAHPLPAAVAALRAAFYTRLAPIAGAWSERLGDAEEFPERLDAYLELCHAAGQTRPTPLMLRYGPGDHNRLHQDIYGALAFPLQVAIALSRPGRGLHRRGVPRRGERPTRPVARQRGRRRAGPRGDLVDAPPSRAWTPRLVPADGASRGERGPQRAAPRPRPHLPRRDLSPSAARYARRHAPRRHPLPDRLLDRHPRARRGAGGAGLRVAVGPRAHAHPGRATPAPRRRRAPRGTSGPSTPSSR